MTPPETRFRLRPFLVRSIMLGVLTALFSGPLVMYVVSSATMLGLDIPPAPQIIPRTSAPLTEADLVFAIAWILFAAPILESLFFPLLYWPTRWIPARKPVFVAVVGVLAFIVHGMTIANVGQAAGFMLMAAWYVHLRDRYRSPSLMSPAKIPYFGIVLAHFSWNATALAFAFGMALFWPKLG